MTIETQISLNMTNNQAPVVVDVVQSEQLTRVISATLYDGAQPWNVPKGAKAGLAFRKPDGTGGLYDQLPNHSIAVTIVGNNVKATLAPQVQSVAGDVAAAIVFMVPSTLERLATFPFVLRVAKDPSAGAPASNNYYRYSTMEEVNAAIKDVQASTNAATKAVAGFQQAVASALPVIMTGREVSTDMVSPVGHEVQCKIIRGNLLPIQPGVVTSTKKIDLKAELEPGEYTISAKSIVTNDSSTNYVTVAFFKGPAIVLSTAIKLSDKVLTKNVPKKFDHILFSATLSTSDNDFEATYTDVMLSKGGKQPFVPSVPDLTEVTVTQEPGAATFKPNAEGVVTGMVSKSPNMEITTDNPDVIIEATYNADTKRYIDKKFAELQAAIISTGGNV